MSSNIYEFFCYSPMDNSAPAKAARTKKHCPILNEKCHKTLSDGSVSGVCTLKPATSKPVICCPIRLYANSYRILSAVAEAAFKQKVILIPGPEARMAKGATGKCRVAVFGKGWGKELRLPNRGRGPDRRLRFG